MIVDVAKLGVGEKEFEGEDPGSILEIGLDAVVRVEGPVRYRLSASLAGRSLIVSGTVEVDVSIVCVKCAELFSVTVSDPSFMRVFEVENRTASVDLTPDLRESIILAFPINPRCAPGCKGVCPRCGMNLNKVVCRCAPPVVDGRWGVLDLMNLA